MSSIKFTNGNIKFIAKVVQKGEMYGKNVDIPHEDEVPLIEFFDARYPMVKIDNQHSGQFISRYDLNTFNHVKTGLFLNSGSPDWSITPATVKMLQDWVKNDLGIVYVDEPAAAPTRKPRP